jgi:hypothetical protein
MKRLLQHYPQLHLVHCYGPVESTLFASTHRVGLADCDRTDGIPLGTPVPNTGLHVWNGSRLCRPGEVGELLISGDGLAIGYVGDPDQAAQQFPTMTLDGVNRRVYRSGDLAHCSGDGTLQFDGRADRQVKVRGHRIEPAEIERVALTVPDVGECAVVPVPGRTGGFDTVLLAYTSHAVPPIGEDDMANQLVGQLPAHLVPGRVMRVSALPLNQNGKLDADALLRRASSLRLSATGPDASVETAKLTMTVAEVVASVLDLPGVEPDVDIVSLGATSLDLGIICTRLATRLGVPVPVSEVIGRTVVRELADWLHEVTDDAHEALPDESTDAEIVPLSEMQKSFLLRQVYYPVDVTGLCPLAWWITGPVDETALAAALRDVQHRHEALRARYGTDERHHDLQPVAVIDPRGPSCELHRLDAVTEPDAEELLRDVLLRPLDIEDGRVWRAVLVRARGTARTLFGVVVHHVAFDGRSEHVLTRDLSMSYAARVAGAAPVFPRAAVTAAEAAKLLRGLHSRTDVAVQRRRWRELLQGIPTLDLPVPSAAATAALPDPVDTGPSCIPATRTFRLGRAEVTAVERLAEAHRVTPFTVWLAAFAAAVRAVTGQSDFGVGVPVSAREGTALTEAVGCFIDVMCLHLRPAADDWQRLVDDTGDVVRTGLSMRAVPLTEVVRVVNPPRTGRDPLYQIMLAYQDSPRGSLTLPDVRVEPLKISPVQATSEVVTELWPTHGGMDVDITYQADRVAGSFPADVMTALVQVIRHGPGASSPADAVGTGLRRGEGNDN